MVLCDDKKYYQRGRLLQWCSTVHGGEEIRYGGVDELKVSSFADAAFLVALRGFLFGEECGGREFY